MISIAIIECDDVPEVELNRIILQMVNAWPHGRDMEIRLCNLLGKSMTVDVAEVLERNVAIVGLGRMEQNLSQRLLAEGFRTPPPILVYEDVHPIDLKKLEIQIIKEFPCQQFHIPDPRKKKQPSWNPEGALPPRPKKILPKSR